MSKTSLALGNLRAFVILLVVGFHSVLAYLTSQPAAPSPFDNPPFDWRAIPILDHERWLGFDLFCAFQYVFLMPFMFLLSGLFVWPSLKRKGSRTFLYDRVLRLGVPFVLGVYLLMPVAHFPVYRSPRPIRAGRRSLPTGWHCRSRPADRCGSCGTFWCSMRPQPGCSCLLRARANFSHACRRPPASAPVDTS
jgi:hypothetical protein